MQPIARNGLTAAQIRRVVESGNLEVDFGCELLDHQDRFLEDISEDLVGGWVERDNLRTVHGTCQLELSRKLDWGSQRVKPYMTLAADGMRFRANLGVYLLGVPERPAGQVPQTYTVSGFDKLLVLDTPVGSSYTAAAGQTYLSRIENLINRAFSPYTDPPLVDRTAAGKTLSAGRMWPIDEENTYLKIITELLANIGYIALWVDWNGRFRCDRYNPVEQRGAEWVYDADDEHTTTIAEDRVATADFTDTPNKFVFIRDDPALATLLYVVNTTTGITSQDARKRTITRIEKLDAVDDAALRAQGDQVVFDARQVARYVDISTSPNPLHWHFDVVEYRDAAFAASGRWLHASWHLPLDGSDMTQRLRGIDE